MAEKVMMHLIFNHLELKNAMLLLGMLSVPTLVAHDQKSYVAHGSITLI